MAAMREAILVASFGTTHPQARDAAIGAIERDIAAAFPDMLVARAFTSSMVARALLRQEGVRVSDVVAALRALAAQGVRRVAVQPTHVIGGYEHDKLVTAARGEADAFEALSFGRPLLEGADDRRELAQELRADLGELAADEGVVFMGHGTGHDADAVYAAMEQALHAAGLMRAFVGTVEGARGLDDVLPRLRAGGVRRARLLPLMVVAGDHALNDMAGDAPESWRCRMEAAGIEVKCILAGLGESARVRAHYVRHAARAVARLKEGV